MKQSEQVMSHILEVQQRLRAIDAELESLSDSLTLKANSENFDNKSMLAFKKTQSELLSEREFLTLKLTALEAQASEAQRTEATERLASIQAESALLATEGETTHARFNALLSELRGLIEDVGVRRQQFSELRDESECLRLKFGLEATQPPACPLPSTTELYALGKALRSVLARPTISEWTAKLQEIRQQQMEEKARLQPARELVVTDLSEHPQAVLAKRLEEERQAHAQRPRGLSSFIPFLR